MKKSILTTLLVSSLLLGGRVYADDDVVVETTSPIVVETTTTTSNADDVPQEAPKETTEATTEEKTTTTVAEETPTETSSSIAVETPTETTTNETQPPKQEDTVVPKDDETSNEIKTNEQPKISISKEVKSDVAVGQGDTQELQSSVAEEVTTQEEKQATLPKTSSENYGLLGIIIFPLGLIGLYLSRKGLL